MRIVALAGALLFGVATLPSAVDAALLTNGSFEDGAYDPAKASTWQRLGSGSTAITGWTVTGQDVDWVQGWWQAADGKRSIDLSGRGAGGLTLSQTVNLAPGEYELSFFLSGNPDGDPDEKNVDLVLTGPGLDGEPLQSFYDTFLAQNTRSEMNYAEITYSFAFGGGNLGIKFQTSNQDFGAVIDNISLSAVPLPGAVWLLGSALAGLGVLRRRRKGETAPIAA